MADATRKDVAVSARVQAAYGKLPLQFEANRGQTDSRVRFLSRGRGYSLFLTSREAVLGIEGSILRMRLVGANRAPQAEGLEALPGKVNYFIGNDPAKWRTNVATYGKVRYQGVYPGIDLIYYGNQRQLEYDFAVAPGADPKRIALEFKGADKLHVDSRGDLVLERAGNQVLFRKPLTYQEVDGVRREVDGRYLLKSRNRVGFEVAAYDVMRPLIIDPVLAYSTYLGGGSYEDMHGIAVDSAGHAYVTGFTPSADFPTTPGAFDTTYKSIFVAKLNESGTALVYSTFLGGFGQNAVQGIAVDADGNAYATGSTGSATFPTTPGAFQTTFAGGPGDAFVTKLNAAGSGLVYSTYLGGRDNDAGLGISLDSAGNSYVTGWTTSSAFPTTSGAFNRTFAGGFDAFVTKLNAAGSALAYSTYLGGVDFDGGLAVAVDTAGSAYVTGVTYSADFPATPGAFQTDLKGGTSAFVTKLDPDGSSLVYSTFLGGAGQDDGDGIAVDAAGSVFVAGRAGSLDFPTTPGAFSRTLSGDFDAFVAKLNPVGSGLDYSTLIGGSGTEWCFGLALDSAGNAHVTGMTFSSNFPTTPGAFDRALGGTVDVYMTKLNPTGSALVYSTYLGGSGGDVGRAIALDRAGNVFLAGETASTDFPVSSGAFQTALRGTQDVFMTKLSLMAALTVTKVVVNDNGGTAQVSDFPLLVDGSPVVSGVQNGFGAGLHMVSEIPSPGYAATFGGDCAPNGSITLNVGDVKNCTITNDDIAPRLTVTKVVVNNHGGTKQAGDFPLFVDGNPVVSGVQNSFAAGTHAVTEASSPAYTAIFTGDCASNGSITLNVGDAKGCTITNTDNAPRLTVTKIVVNDNGGTKQVSDFPLFVDGSPIVSGVQNSFGAGAHAVSETSSPGYTAAFGGDCASNGSITLNIGDMKSCTITNDDIKLPDLIISALTAPATAVAGSTFSVIDTTKNQTGTGPAGLSTTRFYLSTNSTWDAADEGIGGRSVPVLASGATNSGPASVTVPAGIPTGNYYIIAKADGDRELAESNEANNTRYVSIRISPPDLIVSAISVPTMGGAGLTITASNTTKNQTNTGPAPASTTKFYLSANATWEAGDTYLGSQSIGTLNPGSSEAHSTMLTIPAGTTPGNWYVIAKADADGLISETLETNNTASDGMVIGPDLIVSALSAPATGGAGLPITVTDTTKNQGGGTASASTTRFYLSANSTLGGGDVLLGSRSVGQLAPGALSSGASTTLTIPAGTAVGSYYIIAVADDPPTVPETVETNNTRAVLIKLSPDLVVSALTVPTSAPAGSTITVGDTTKNQGYGSAVATTTSFYLSGDTTWDASDVQLNNSRTIPILASGASSAGTTSLLIPRETIPGIWYLLARADATGAVAEASEANNTASRVITITQALP